MCARPAKWMVKRQQFGMYCAGVSCTNRDRTCQTCQKPFTLNTDGAGNKYCSTKCKIMGYHPRADNRTICCAWCAREGRTKPNAHRIWPYICEECLQPIKHVVDRLKAHHVPHERARILLVQPGCEVCGTNLLTKKSIGSHGSLRSMLVVDHDHGCCPSGQVSCGQCVRGLICRNCNAAAGLLFDSPESASALAGYLNAYSN